MGDAITLMGISYYDCQSFLPKKKYVYSHSGIYSKSFSSYFFFFSEVNSEVETGVAVLYTLLRVCIIYSSHPITVRSSSLF